MATTKTIAIVGATGKMGASIAKALAGNRKYRLLLMSHDEDNLVALKFSLQKNGAEVYALSCAREAAWEADIIIVATPQEEEKEVVEKIREVAIGKIVISVSNPANQGNDAPVTPADASAAEHLQKLLPYSKVVKTFNSNFPSSLMTAVIGGKTADAFIAGNNGDAVDTVSDLVKSVGFNPVVAGDLTASRTLERIQLLLGRLANTHTAGSLAGGKLFIPKIS
jgi:predicted dinucleotide-binding enzyme